VAIQQWFSLAAGPIFNGPCAARLVRLFGAPLDLERALDGPETVVTSYRTGCRDGARAELWAITGGAHVPAFQAGFAAPIVDFLLSATRT
jgi:hypothetical protein